MKPIGELHPNSAETALPSATDVSIATDIVALAKPGIVKMVLVATAVGFFLAALQSAWDIGTLILTIAACAIGTTLSGAGANALNQVLEIRRDGLMPRTEDRPLPSGRISVGIGAFIGLLMSGAGVLILWVGTNPAAAIVSLATIISYTLIYTPLKPVTPLATLVGAVPGAAPPLIGWAAASVEPWGGLLHPAAWSIFLLMFVWQVPHFLAIAWKYREQYQAAGHKVLPVVDPSGVRTGWSVMVWSITLIPISLGAVSFIGEGVGWLYAIVAVLAGLGFVYSGVRMAWLRTDRAAFQLFLVSIAYLPIVLMAMVCDAMISAIF